MAKAGALYDPLQLQQRQQYANVWHTDLRGAIAADCPWCCLSIIGPCCVSYILRSRTLYDDMSRYQCCGGYMPCSGRCGEQKCPQFCLCMEVTCCFGSSVATTRFLLQDQFNIQTTPCDNCIIGFMFVLQQIACIFSIIACVVAISTGNNSLGDVAQALNCLADIVWCSVCACMQTQHKVQLDKRDGKFGDAPVTAPPPAQHMSRMDQGYPPQGYPPQGYPPQGYPAQPGYPPQGYPPHQGY